MQDEKKSNDICNGGNGCCHAVGGMTSGRRYETFIEKGNRMRVPDPIDTSAMDEEFYSQMRRFEALHPENVPLDR